MENGIGIAEMMANSITCGSPITAAPLFDTTVLQWRDCLARATADSRQLLMHDEMLKTAGFERAGFRFLRNACQLLERIPQASLPLVEQLHVETASQAALAFQDAASCLQQHAEALLQICSKANKVALLLLEVGIVMPRPTIKLRQYNFLKDLAKASLSSAPLAGAHEHDETANNPQTAACPEITGTKDERESLPSPLGPALPLGPDV